MGYQSKAGVTWRYVTPRNCPITPRKKIVHPVIENSLVLSLS